MDSNNTTEEWKPIIDYKELSYKTYMVCAKLCRDACLFQSIAGDYGYDGRILAMNLYKYAVTLLYQKIINVYGRNSSELFLNELAIVDAFSMMMLCSTEELTGIIHDPTDSQPDIWSSDLMNLNGALDAKERIDEINKLVSDSIIAIEEFEDLPF